MMTIGKGSLTQPLTTSDVEQLLAEACAYLPVDGKCILVIIPDGTRTAPIPLFFRLLYEQLGQRVAQLDYLIALGTHLPMSEEAIDQLVGVSAVERAEHYPKVQIFNHLWSQPEMLQTIGLITHLEWFTELLQQAGLRPAEHLLVMTLPGSYLDRFAEAQQAPSLPLQLDGGTGTGGRMSAPTTRVFLLPAALYLTHLSGEPGQLRTVLRRAWNEYDLALATERPADHPFVQLAAALSDASLDGACRLLLSTPEGWQAIVPWIEQLMEESLGKGGKGVVVFDDQFLNPQAPAYRSSGTLQVRVVTDLTQPEEEKSFNLYQPYLARKEPLDRLAAVATNFLGWQLSMALYGYLHRITFAGQPAVENYKARARVLRTQDDPLQVTKHWAATTTEIDPSSGISYSLLAPQGVEIRGSPASIVARTLQRTAQASPKHLSLGYLDLTINGELPSSLLSALDAHLHTIGNELLGIPAKLRRAPAAYHSTEQSEMDGPPFLVSLRILARDHEASILGSYTDTFLCAQAVSTWQAMMEQGRPCFLLIIDGSIDNAVEPLHRFFSDIAAQLGGQ